jgi:hypothetical protein
MRNPTLLISVIAVTLLAAAAGTAFAQPGGPGAGGDDRPAKRGMGNHTADDNSTANHSRAEAMKARVAELREARAAALASFKENRTDALADYHAAHNATRASFLENKTRVLEACQAAKNASRADNSTRGNQTGAPEHAKCVRDGLKPLIEKARAEHKEAREELQERLHGARKASIEAFRAAVRDADARHGPRSG